jgi:hypothetical protein
MESRYYPLHADHTLGQWYLPEFFQVLLSQCATPASEANTTSVAWRVNRAECYGVL